MFKMNAIKQTEAYQKWECRLKDKLVKAGIAARLFRLANGLAGDVLPVGSGISELGIHYGPGYRICFLKHKEVILLLCGGNKSSQWKDIEYAKKLANAWQD